MAAGRASEQLTREQSVPADATGVTAGFSRAIGRSTLMLGVERAQVSASTVETAYLPGRTEETTARGTQTNLGGFADLALGVGRGGSLTLGARYDRWTNSDAERVTPQGTTLLPERTASATSPRVALLLKLGSRVSVMGSAYRAFRAPTLNELYRPFRVGDVVTLANELLDAERVEGTEAGFRVGGRRLSLRATVFRMRTEDTVSSVTLSTAPGLITRQRRNLGASRSQGVEVDAELRAGIATLQLGWLRADAIVRSFDADPSLEGNRLPQVPRSQGTVSLRLAGESGRTLAVFGRWAGAQFDDDRNLYELGPMRQLDAFAALPLSGSFDVVAAGENLFNYRYEIGRTPLPTIASPRAVRLGVRLRLASLPVVQPD